MRKRDSTTHATFLSVRIRAIHLDRPEQIRPSQLIANCHSGFRKQNGDERYVQQLRSKGGRKYNSTYRSRSAVVGGKSHLFSTDQSNENENAKF